MAKVYIVQESPGKNITMELDFGEIEVLLPPDKQLTFSPGPIIHILRTKLAHFTDEDYILLIGDPAAIGVVCACAAEWNQGRFKMLKWDRQTGKYFPIQITIHPERSLNGLD